MKKTIKHLVFLLILSYTSQTRTTLIIQGNDTTAPRGFTQQVLSKTYDRLRGTFFVGLDSGAAAYAISRADRPNFQQVARFTGIATDQSSAVANNAIEFLALSPQSSPVLPVLAAVVRGSSEFLGTAVSALFSNGGRETASGDINDANATLSTTGGIVALAASSSHVFAAVRPNGPGTFGDANSGIAVLEIDASNPCNNNTDATIGVQPMLAITPKDANTGLDGNRAVELTVSTPAVRGGGSNVVFSNNNVDMYYDETLARLYIAVQLQTGAAVNDIGKSVVAARLNPAAKNMLLLEGIAPDSAITIDPIDEIIVARSNGAAIDLAALHVRTMHTSTGPSYLIVHGGRNTANQVGNRIRAFPLVNDATNPTAHGTLANKNAALSTSFVFTTPATAPGDLPRESEAAATVGAGNLPLSVDDTISDMVVVGDTVYVSIEIAPSTGNDTGIFYSQVIFDKDGKIERWTPWTKRATPLNAFPGVTLPTSAPHNGCVRFFDVDAKTGNIWIVEGTSGRLVGLTTWSTGTESTGLTAQLNNLLCRSAYSVLDLDQATRGFFNATIHRYALFGGVNKVVFARTSQATVNNNISAPQSVTPITDYTSADNILETKLPTTIAGGCVQVLEYSRRETGEQNTNYFFAGTEQGLFAFADTNGNGFNSNTLGLLSATPFTGAWQFVSAIPGSIIDIKTSGAGNLYVLAQNGTTTNPFNSTLYSIPFNTTVATMFAAGNIRTIAQTGTAPFAGVLQFTGIQIVATGQPDGANPEDKEQLVLATNQGLFRSNANQNGAATGIPNAANQTAADWQLVPNTTTIPYLGIAGMDTPIRHTVWPFSLQDPNNCKLFERGSIDQLSANGDATGDNPCFNTTNPFIPAIFNANPAGTTFATLEPINHFFSDGARRFFIFNRACDPFTHNRLTVLPFNVSEWNVTQIAPLSHPVLDQVERFFWVHHIGATGLFMAGTNSGVVALE